MKREPHAMRALDIRPENPDQEDVITLIAASDEYLASLYPAESNHSLDIASLARPEVTFFVARIDGKAVGCGAISCRKKEYAEIKRMFVAHNARETGELKVRRAKPAKSFAAADHRTRDVPHQRARGEARRLGQQQVRDAVDAQLISISGQLR